MRSIAETWSGIKSRAKKRRRQLGLSLRVTIAAIATLLIAQRLDMPIGGLWAVLTSVIVSQMSVGGSLKATVEYVVGTLGGAIYAAALAVALPHASELAFLVVLAVAIAPLALIASIHSSFRVAPFTAIIVLVGVSSPAADSIYSALNRVMEVALGGLIALLVSFLVIPTRAQVLAMEAAARLLDRMADAVPMLFSGFTRKADAAKIRTAQDAIGRAVAQVETAIAEARRERMTHLIAEPDLAPLGRTALRLRHDFVMIGRAAIVPLPDALQERLGPLIHAVGDALTDYLHASAAALVARRDPPPVAAVEAAFGAYTAGIAGVRAAGLTHDLSVEAVERLFALGFTFDQLHRNFADLERCMEESARRAAIVTAGAGIGTRPAD